MNNNLFTLPRINMFVCFFCLMVVFCVSCYLYPVQAGTGVKDSRLDSGNTVGKGNSGSSQLSSDSNGHVYATWRDSRNGDLDIYFNYSSDYGMTWQINDIRLDTGDAPGANTSYRPQISSDSNGHVYVTWIDFRNGDSAIYFNYSSDYGVTWQINDIRLDTGDAPGANRTSDHQISSDSDGHVYVTWIDSRNGYYPDIYFNYSSDYGVTWQINDIRLDTGDAPGANSSFRPQISSDANGHIYVTWIDSRNGYYPDIYFNYSSDYGVTWQINDIRLDTGDAPGANSSFRPQISSDANGHIYVTWTDFRNGSSDIYLNYSSDYGMTWQINDIRLDTGDAPGANSSSSPQISSDDNGHVYVTWMDHRNNDLNIYFNYSSDYGITWQKNDIRLGAVKAAGEDYSFGPHGPQISSDSNGHVYVARVEGENEDYDIYVDYSPDYGKTWLTSVTKLNAVAKQIINPRIDSNGNGQVYVTWTDFRNRTPDIYFNYSSDYGITWLKNDIRLDIDTPTVPGLGHSRNAKISSDNNGHVYAVWFDSSNGSIFNDFDVYFNYSSDYGKTWQKNDIRLNTSDASSGGNSLDDPVNTLDPDLQISSDSNGNVYVIWTDYRNGRANIYFNYSSDYGITWQKNDIRLDAGVGANPQISSDASGHVYVTWHGGRKGFFGAADIYFNYSSDYGKTWQAEAIRLDTGDAPGANGSYRPQINSDSNGHVYVTWHDSRNGSSDIYFNYSSDYGITWQKNDIRLDTGDGPGANHSFGPQISGDANGHIYVTWTDERNGRPDIYLNYSSDYGVTWQINDIRLDTGDAPGANWSRAPQIKSNVNGNVYVTWDESIKGIGAIYFNCSSDYGKTWQAKAIRLDTGAVNPFSLLGYPQISSDDNGHVYVTWQDARNDAHLDVHSKETSDIYLNYSSDYGKTWQKNDIRLDTGDGPGANHSFGPQISSDSNGHVYVVWQDDRNANPIMLEYDIFNTIYFNYFFVDEIVSDNNFSDIVSGGTTFGTIIDSGDQELTIIDEPNPTGFRIAADNSNGLKHATIGACGNNTTINLDAGDEIVLTCDSGTNIDVINGIVEAIFTMPDGLFTAISVLGQGNGIAFAPDTFGLTAPSHNTEAVPVVVIIETNGKWSLLSISPGEALELIVNDLVAKEYDPVTSFNINPAPDAPAGAFTIIATFTNTSAKTIKYPFFVVSRLSGGNLLLNADDPPGSVGSILTPEVDNDALLPGESMTVDFIIGLQDDSEFTFFTDLLGIPE